MHLSHSRWDEVAARLAALGNGASFGERFTVVRERTDGGDRWGFAWQSYGKRRAIFIDGGPYVARRLGGDRLGTWENQQAAPHLKVDVAAADAALAALGLV